MSNVSQISTDGVTYDLKDAFMRSITPDLATTTNKLISQSETDVIGTSNISDTIIITGAANAMVQRLKIFGEAIVDNYNIIGSGEMAGDITITSHAINPTFATIDSELPLYGVPIVRNNSEYNNIRYGDKKWLSDIYDSLGKKIAYTYLVDLGNLTWEKYSFSSPYTGIYFTAELPYPAKILDGEGNRTVNDFLFSRTDVYEIGCLRDTLPTGDNKDNIIFIRQGGVCIRDTSYSSGTVEAFKTHVTGMKLLYQLGTPIESIISNTDKEELRNLLTGAETTRIETTSDDYLEVTYLKDTVNGNALAMIQSNLQAQIDALNNA